MDRDKNITVSNRLKQVGMKIGIKDNWNLGVTSVEGISEVQDVEYMLSCVRISENSDIWAWDQKQGVSFSVAAVKTALRGVRDGQSALRMRWVNWVPIKVNILVWRIEQDRLPTRVELAKRRIELPSTICPMCDIEEESVSHVFVSCGFAFGVWSKVWRWCRLFPDDIGSIEDMLSWQNLVPNTGRGRKLLRAIIMVTCWAIWKERNKVVFQNSIPQVVGVVTLVKSMSYLWIKYRSNNIRIDWNEWVKYPLYNM